MTLPDLVLLDEFGAAMHRFIETFGTDLMDSTFQSMTCYEADRMAEMLRLGGAVIGEQVEGEQAARLVLAQHYGADEGGDRHWMGIGEKVRWLPAALPEGSLHSEREGKVLEDDAQGFITVEWADGGTDVVHVADLDSIAEEN